MKLYKAMKLDKAWFNTGPKYNPRMKEVVRNVHFVVKGFVLKGMRNVILGFKGKCVVESGTCDIKEGK